MESGKNILPEVRELTFLTVWCNEWWVSAFILILVGMILYHQLKIQKLNRQLQEQRQEKEQLKTLHALQNRMVTNITHEFRTPLTVILGLADEIKRHPGIHFAKRLALIRKNGQHLLQFVNQLLDLACLDAQKMKANPKLDDAIGFLRVLVDSFHSHAFSRGIGLQFYAEEDSFTMDFDPDHLQRIITNLLSNAIKFTPEFGKVLVVVKIIPRKDRKYLEVKIRDSGCGIEPEKIPYIFDRFYRADQSSIKSGEGSGIGLTLVKELLGLMGGSIKVKSQLGKGTCVMFRIPVTQKAERLEIQSPPDSRMMPVLHGSRNDYQTFTTPNRIAPEIPVALLVEDNPDVVYFLRSCLGKKWQVHAAPNGLTGLEKARELIPDVIICDVMLPGLNGLELVEQLKTDEHTRHIPVLLLSARSSQSDKMEGLRKGADAYLFKPLDKEELLLRLDNFLHLRCGIKKYLKLGLPGGEKLPPEQKFLKKIDLLLQDHLDDPEFNATLLAREVGVGRPQLHRKLKAITSKSTAIYMRSFRLEKARQLLLNTNLRISEIVWKTGFKSLSWFNQAYKQEFGETPSETRK